MAFTKITHAGIGSTGTVLLENLEVTGVGTFGGSVSVGGTLTYEDVTNVDSVGLITARNGIVVGSGITLSKDGDGFFTGVVTATSYAGSGANLTGIDTDLVSDTSPQLGGNLDVNTKNIVFGDSGSASDDRLTFGASTDLSIYHDGSHSRIDETGTGNLMIQSDNAVFIKKGTSENIAVFNADGAVDLYYDNSKKLETTSAGVSVTGSATVSGDLSIAASLVHTGDTDTKITFANNVIKFDTDTNERIRIDNNGKVLIGATSGVNGFTDIFQIFQNTATAAITLKRASDNAYAPYINFIKARGTTSDSATVLQSGDIMAYIRFSGTDGTDTTESAIIQAVVDGTPGNNDMPGRLVFSTTADGSNASTERLRITSAGDVGINVTSPSAKLDVVDDSAGGYIAEFRQSNTSNSGQIVIDSPTDSDSRPVSIDMQRAGTTKWSIGQGYNSSGGAFHFATSALQSGVTGVKASFLTGGGLTFNGDTAAANALDDYEEGTWTPTYLFGGSDTSTYTNRSGSYTKIGNFIFAKFAVDISSRGSGSGRMDIGGLPFTIGDKLSSTGQEVGGMISYFNGLDINVSMIGYWGQNGNSYVQLQYTSGSGNTTIQQYLNKSQIADNTGFRGYIIYQQ